MSLEPQTFGFPLDSCPDALPVSHGDLDGNVTDEDTDLINSIRGAPVFRKLIRVDETSNVSVLLCYYNNPTDLLMFFSIYHTSE